MPTSMIAGRVHGCDPPVRSLLLHLGKLVVPSGLKDQMSGAIAGETDDEVGLEIVRRDVVEIRDRKAEARNFNEGVNALRNTSPAKRQAAKLC